MAILAGAMISTHRYERKLLSQVLNADAHLIKESGNGLGVVSLTEEISFGVI